MSNPTRVQCAMCKRMVRTIYRASTLVLVPHYGCLFGATKVGTPLPTWFRPDDLNSVFRIAYTIPTYPHGVPTPPKDGGFLEDVLYRESPLLNLVMGGK